MYWASLSYVKFGYLLAIISRTALFVPYKHGEGLRLQICVISRMNRRKADFKFAYKFLEDDV